MKKVVFAIPRLTGGGAERVVSVWANELNSKGFDIRIVLFYRSKDEYFTSEEVEIYSLVDTLEEYMRLSFKKKWIGLRSILKKIDPDYIVSFLPAMQVWMMLASIGSKAKRIETIRVNPWKVSIPGITNKLIWKICYHTAYKIILQATDQKPFFSWFDQRKTVLIPNPISDTYLQEVVRCVPEHPTRFIAVGRLEPQKNYPMMIEAFSHLIKSNNNISLRIFGEGEKSYMDYLETLIIENKVSGYVKLMGRTPRIEQEYNKSDIFLMCSDFEGLPNALMEAMASGLICISTDCKTGPRDLIDDGINGFLVSVGNVEEMSEIMNKILCMPVEIRQNISQNARKKILQYCSKENSVERLIKLLS